ncbi:tetratricopeptide repeat protein [Suipraeoptans intestinalis]|uniref:tetratricopeptide repeat protein n=1 Tax=Suipraeoptans intestinalis TaxID=2606628 RepID=UPI0023EF9FEC|nr:tetratricopeptide repeat protein [Suipraeoptans intestinalis]MDD7769419.1 tetratricopeptide repeat protein [Suipraeoptans intestinalis]MDY3121019.1 tetratricopeptide repeat protein [Suipraeoptans intestinalis]
MEYTTKILYQSHICYNEGLKKANIRDLTGAATALKKSLQYDGTNVAARNLLGLVYYGRGDVAEALTEWILSKNIQPKDNIANYFIKTIKESKAELLAVNQAVKRYNRALEYCWQNAEDLALIQLKKAVQAHPGFVKAYQLMGLLYLHGEQYSLARQAIRSAYKLDTTDEITLSYMHELNQVRKTRPVSMKGKRRETVTYHVGNETIIQPVPAGQRERGGYHSIVNILLGILVGTAIMGLLVMPAISGSRQNQTNKQAVEFGDKIAEQEAQIRALKKDLEGYRANSEETENAQATAASTQSSYEIVMNIESYYRSNSMSDEAMIDELLKVNPAALGTAGRSIYEEMAGVLYPRACERLYTTSKANMQVANYDTAITNLERVVQIEEGYSDGQALLLLAQAYEGKGDTESAQAKYQRLADAYGDTQAGATAKEKLGN